MATYTDARQLSAAQIARARRLKYGRTSIETQCQAGAKIAYDVARELTSGTTKTAELTAAGHPFARSRRMGRIGAGEKFGAGASMLGAFPLLSINNQTGSVYNGWKVIRVPGQNGGYTYRLQNMSPHAKFVLAPGGTKSMVDRGFWVELNRRTLPKLRRQRLELYRAALKG